MVRLHSDSTWNLYSTSSFTGRTVTVAGSGGEPQELLELDSELWLLSLDRSLLSLERSLPLDKSVVSELLLEPEELGLEERW